MNRRDRRRKAKGPVGAGLNHEKITKSRKRVENLEDLRDLNAAIDRNAGKSGIPWERAKKELGL